MKTLITGAIVFLLWCLFARWHYVCQIKGLCGGVHNVEANIADQLDIEDDEIKLKEEDKFVYEEKEVMPELSEDNLSTIASISQLMKDDPNTNLIIQGAYTPEEKDVKPGFFENLGLARADAVRKMFVDEGIEENRISLDFTEDADALSNPIRFRTTGETKVAEYTFSNMSFSDISFASESAQFNPNRQFNLYADSVKVFLSLNPDKKIIVTGHTDDRGEEELNYRLGIRRANTVRYYLQQRGIRGTIDVASKGETSPIADNTTAEGRRKNRRVQITIQ